MPETISEPQAAAPETTLVDSFVDRVIRAFRRHEARAHLAQQITDEPFCYSISATADFSGLPEPLLRRLCRTERLRSIKIDNRWLIHRDEFHRLLVPDVTLRSRAARRHILIRNLQRLAAMLYTYEAAHILHVLLHDLRRATAFRDAGACYEDAEGMVWARAERGIHDGIFDPDQTEEALGLLRVIIGQGMELLRNIDWRQDRLVSMIAEHTGVDLGPGRSSLLPIDATCDYPIDLSFAI